MTRLLLAFALLAPLSVGAAFADDAPTDGGVAPAAAAPAPPPSKFKNVPPRQLDSAKISGDVPHLPDLLKIKLQDKGEVAGSYKICVGTDGNVASVETIVSIPGGDDAVTSKLRTWKFRPLPQGICSVERFVFTIGAGPPPEPRADSGRSGISVTKVSGDQPHLPDRLRITLARDRVRRVIGVYQICVGRDGHVSSVKPLRSIAGGDEAIMTTLQTWTFQPQQHWNTVCSPAVFTFDIG